MNSGHAYAKIITGSFTLFDCITVEKGIAGSLYCSFMLGYLINNDQASYAELAPEVHTKSI